MARSLAGASATVALGLGLVGLRAAAAQPPPRFGAGVEIVRIEAVVVDGRGEPVAGLSADDFEVTDGSIPRPLVSFEPIVVHPPPPQESSQLPDRVAAPRVATAEENRCFLVYFDDVHVHARNTEAVRAHLERFLEDETREGDWVTIMAPLAGLRFTARTAFERSRLPVVVRTLKGQLVRPPTPNDPSDFAAMRTVEYGSPAEIAASASYGRDSTFTASQSLLAQEAYQVAQRRIHRSLAGLTDAIQSLAGFRGRKTILIYTEGFIRSPSLPDYDRVVELARCAQVVLYAVDPRGTDRETIADELATSAGGSTYLALSTGGRVTTSNDFAAEIRQVGREASVYYLLGFTPTAGKAGEHGLTVRVRRPGLAVRAPDRYVAGDTPAPASAKPAVVDAVERVQDAVEIPIRVSVLFTGQSRKEGVVATVAVEVPRAGAGDDHRLDLLIEARRGGPGLAVRDSATLVVEPGEGSAVATRDLLLEPGLWQARVVVRDPQLSRAGSVLHTFEVLKGDGLTISSAVLGDSLESDRVPRPRLRVSRYYRSDGALYCSYRVLGARTDPASGRPKVRAGYSIAGAGSTRREAAPTPIEPASDGSLRRLLGFGLADLSPGPYTLTLQVVDDVTGETREVVEPFSVVASR